MLSKTSVHIRMKRFITFLFIILLGVASHGDLLAQWVRTNGPYGGYISAIGISGTNILAGTNDYYQNSMVFSSSNGGTSWTKSTSTDFAREYALTFASNGTNLFAGTAHGVYRSIDNGVTWASVGLNQVEVVALAFIGQNVVAGSQSGEIYNSTDEGSNWVQTNPESPGSTLLSLTAVGTSLYAGTQNAGVIVSSDLGASWIRTGMTAYFVYSVFAEGSTLFAGTRDSIYRSTDNGTSWKASFADSTSYLIYSLLSIGTDLFAGTWGGGILRSTDNGVTWSASNKGLDILNVRELVANGTTLYAGTNNGVYQSTDMGSNWHAATIGLSNMDAHAMTVSGPYLLTATVWGGIARSKDSGASWELANVGMDGYSAYALASSGSNLLVGTNGQIFLSKDNGTTWAATIGATGTIVTSFAVDGSNVVAGGSNGIATSNDGGETWTKGPIGNNIHSINSLLIFDSTILAATYGGGVFRSTDTAHTWTLTSEQPMAYTFSLYQYGPAIFAGTKAGLFKSTSRGATWSEVGAGIVIGEITSFTSTGPYLFAGTSSGVFVSSDQGSTWTAASIGTTPGYVSSLAINGARLYAGTQAGGVWERPLAEMTGTSAVEHPTAPTYSIRSYPNPFTKSTTISFTSGSGIAQVSIVNLLGDEVARLFEGQLDQGEHSFAWHPAGSPDGVYECVVKMNGRTEKLPIMLLR